MSLRAVIADADAASRAVIRESLLLLGNVEVVAEIGGGQSVLPAVERFHPDILFLDTQSPDAAGGGFWERMGKEDRTKVVFTAPNDRHALAAFEKNAFDYLVKPIDQERLARTLKRLWQARQNGAASGLNDQVISILRGMRPAERPLRLAFKSKGRVVFLKVEDIRYAVSDGNYMQVFAESGTHYFRETMTNLESRLPAERFARIHRSILVNLNSIKEIHSQSAHGESSVILLDGTRLPLSRTYRSHITRGVRRERAV